MADARWREAEALALAGEDEYVKGGAVAGVGLVALARGELDVAEDCFLRSLPHTEGQGGYGDWLQSLCTSGSARSTWCAATCAARCSRCATAWSPRAAAATG
jgi:hypothetical protein